MEFEDSNKISLEQHLTNLSSRPRIEILKRLHDQITPVEYRELQKVFQKFTNDKKTLAYHINVLKVAHYIILDKKGYLITPLGYSVVKELEKFEEGLSDSSKIKVRTSKYTLELFDESIIEKKIIEESNLNLKEAKKVANEAKKRIRKANITYLTAPLIREFVNAILIEFHLEDTRHKLTRLGLPPYDIKQMINSQEYENPSKFEIKLGNAILEQNTLLNKINQKFADNLLSGQFLLTNLKNFGISPLELVISGQNFIEVLNNFYNQSLEEEKPHDEDLLDENFIAEVYSLPYIEFIHYFEQTLSLFQSFFPQGLTIIRFDEFLEKFLKFYTEIDLKHLFSKIFVKLTENWAITLGISLIANFNDINPLLDIYVDSLSYPIKTWSQLPVLEIHFTKNKIKELLNCLSYSKLNSQQQNILSLLLNHQVNINQFSKRGVQNGEHIFTNLGIPIQYNLHNEINPSIIIEKISINLLSIFKESSNNETKFFSNLEKAIFSIFDYYDNKFKLLSKTLLKFPEWKKISQLLFNNDPIFQNWKDTQKYHSDYPLFCGISFYGLDELIYLKSGLFIKDQSKNRDLAVKVLDYIYSLIQKQNSTLSENIKFILCESHYQNELLRRNDLFLQLLNSKGSAFQPSTIPGYRFGFNTSPKFLSLNHLSQIYFDLLKSRFKELSINIPLQGDNFDGDFDKILEFCQNIIKTNISRISFSKNYEYTNKKSPKIVYGRYYSNYYPNWGV
jgi:DNA-binding transcriptional ArsR family regulator